jgi:cytoskeletal protein CcmA (bactofilin family)
MATSYTLRFSDPTKTDTVSISGPIKNNYDTSLDLVGPGYVNYGQAIAQDFLKLLENFASPFPPVSPIEGQLWYDTSNPNRKVLRVNNGASTTARWPSANGIYQQTYDPANQYGQNLVEGDIWVDTATAQLKIRSSDTWTIIGPNSSSGENKTGSETVELVSNTGEIYPVILHWANGKVVEIISYNEFTPRTVIDGFATLSAGINLTNKVSAKYNGLVDRAKSLEVSSGVYIQASEVLKNKIPTATRQTHIGTLVVESVSGLISKRPNSTNELQLYSPSMGTSVLNFTYDSGSLRTGINSRVYALFNGQTGNIDITTLSNSGTVYIHGAADVSAGLSVDGNTTIGGSVTVSGNLEVESNVMVTGRTTLTNFVTVEKDIVPSTSTVTLGSAAMPFDRIYVQNIGTTSTTTFINMIAAEATKLSVPRNFQITGVVTSTAVSFNGTATVTFTATAHKSMITSLTNTTSTTATQTIMVVDTSTSTSSLVSISKGNFLSDVYPSLIQTGMIMPSGTSTSYTGFLYCNGTQYQQSAYQQLYTTIGDQYNTGTTTIGYFKVPNLTTATVNGYNGYPIFYHIKT